MNKKKSKRKSSKGEATIHYRSNGRGTYYLSLWIPSRLCEGDRGRRYSLGLADTLVNRALADQVRRQVQLDLERGSFEWDKDKYLPPAIPIKKVVLEPPTPQEIWDNYRFANAYRVKATTLSVWQAVSDRIKLAPVHPDKFLKYLHETTTDKRIVQIFAWLGTAYRSAVKKGLVLQNPFFALDIPAPQNSSEANPFSKQEKIKFLEIAQHSEYYLFVQFMLLTGCRPSEAVGLTWQQVDSKTIKFDRSITLVDGKPTPSEKSKTNRIRYFPIYDRLQKLLDSCPKRSLLVFPAEGEITCINYLAFSYWWRTRVNSWKQSTPYTCRDTFITDQILLGVPPVVVGQWCDNSVIQIERRYLKVLPSDFLPR